MVKLRCDSIRKRKHEKQTLKYKVAIQKFLQDDKKSRVAPCKKDCMTKNKIKKQKRFLNDTMRNLYKSLHFSIAIRSVILFFVNVDHSG